MENGVTTTSLMPRCCFSVSHIGFTAIIYILLSFVVLFITSFSLNRFDKVWLFLVCHSEFLFNSLALFTFFCSLSIIHFVFPYHFQLYGRLLLHDLIKVLTFY